MSLIHDVIKIQYISQGYLPNYPYHMISDKEMFEAFLHPLSDDTDSCFFSDMYPLEFDSMSDQYEYLISCIQYHINKYLANEYTEDEIPDWIYSYMLGVTIGPNSDPLDRHDLLNLMNLDNVEDEFTDKVYSSCLKYSSEWLRKLSESELDHRPPTMFGEPHVIKYLRILELS